MASVGVPDTTPIASVIPSGNVPDCRVIEIVSSPITKSFKSIFVIAVSTIQLCVANALHAGDSEIVIATVPSAVPRSFIALNVKVTSSLASVGVPDRMLVVVENVMPSGNVPDCSEMLDFASNVASDVHANRGACIPILIWDGIPNGC